MSSNCDVKSGLNLANFSPSPKSVDRDLWITILLFLYIAVVLIDINPHTKFDVATMIGTLKSTSCKNLNLEKIGLSPKSVDHDLWVIISGSCIFLLYL